MLASDETTGPLFGDVQCHFERLATFDMAKQFLVAKRLSGIGRHAVGMSRYRTDFIQESPLHLHVVAAMNPFIERWSGSIAGNLIDTRRLVPIHSRAKAREGTSATDRYLKRSNHSAAVIRVHTIGTNRVEFG